MILDLSAEPKILKKKSRVVAWLNENVYDKRSEYVKNGLVRTAKMSTR